MGLNFAARSCPTENINKWKNKHKGQYKYLYKFQCPSPSLSFKRFFLRGSSRSLEKNILRYHANILQATISVSFLLLPFHFKSTLLLSCYKEIAFQKKRSTKLYNTEAKVNARLGSPPQSCDFAAF